MHTAGVQLSPHHLEGYTYEIGEMKTITRRSSVIVKWLDSFHGETWRMDALLWMQRGEVRENATTFTHPRARTENNVRKGDGDMQIVGIGIPGVRNTTIARCNLQDFPAKCT